MERELYRQSSSHTELVLTNERLQNDLTACRIELKTAMQQSTQLASEKAEIVSQLYLKLDQERAAFDSELLVGRRANEDLQE